MSLGKRHLSVVLQVEPLDAAPHQILPAWFHGCAQETGIQGSDLTYITTTRYFRFVCGAAAFYY